MTTVMLYVSMLLSNVHDMEKACNETIEYSVLQGDTYEVLVDSSSNVCNAWVEMSRLFDPSDEDSIQLDMEY